MPFFPSCYNILNFFLLISYYKRKERKTQMHKRKDKRKYKRRKYKESIKEKREIQM